MPVFSDILVPVDFSEASADAFRSGLVMARPNGATVHLMHDIEIPTETITGATTVKERMDEAYDESERKMDELKRIPEAQDATIRTVIQRSTEPKRSILAYADENDVDLVVMATHGRTKAAEKVLGSTAERVLRRSPSPTVVVPPGHGRDRIERILVPVDFSDVSARAADHAIEIAGAHGAQITLLHAESEDPSEAVKDRLRNLFAEHGGDDDATFVASTEGIAEAVTKAAVEQRADLILMVTHGRTGLRRVVTSNVAESVIHRAPCPVMTYRTALEE